MRILHHSSDYVAIHEDEVATGEHANHFNGPRVIAVTAVNTHQDHEKKRYCHPSKWGTQKNY